MMDGTTTDKTVDNGANCVVSGMVFVSVVLGLYCRYGNFVQ